MKARNGMRCRALMAALSLAASGCLQPDPQGTAAEPDPVRIQDGDRLAGATSSTNWPPEDAGRQPLQVFGKADSALELFFKRAPAPGEEPVPARAAARILLYRAGAIPVLDSVPTLDLDFPATDTLRIGAGDLAPFLAAGTDSLAFSVEIRSDSGRGLLTGFLYSGERKKFLEWPGTINSDQALPLTDPHYSVAGLIDSAYRAALADTQGSAEIYYYIPASPYFWKHRPVQDSLYIGPAPKGAYRIRCLKATSRSGFQEDYAVDVFAISVTKQPYTDPARGFEFRDVYRPGPALIHVSGRGGLRFRVP